MSISFKLDDKNNIISSDRIITAEGTDALIQDVGTLLSLTKGEYPYNINMGIDYLGYLQQMDSKALFSDITSRILSDNRVRSVGLAQNQTRGTLTFNARTTEKEGEAVINVEI